MRTRAWVYVVLFLVWNHCGCARFNSHHLQAELKGRLKDTIVAPIDLSRISLSNALVYMSQQSVEQWQGNDDPKPIVFALGPNARLVAEKPLKTGTPASTLWRYNESYRSLYRMLEETCVLHGLEFQIENERVYITLRDGSLSAE